MRRRHWQRSRNHSVRIRRCRRLAAKLTGPELLTRYTRTLALDEVEQLRTDYAICCPISRDWLLSHSRRLVCLTGPRWTS